MTWDGLVPQSEARKWRHRYYAALAGFVLLLAADLFWLWIRAFG